MKNEKLIMPGIIFDSKNDNPIVDSDDSNYYIEYGKTGAYFATYENQIHFIKAVESLVRGHAFYKKYIKFLIEVVGIKTCQVLPNIEVTDENSKITLEMHHGPMLTLFDVTNIILNYLRKQEYPKITTFRVARIVLEEHRKNRVRLVRLSKTVHQQVTENKIFLNNNQGFGDVTSFLKIYHEGLDKRLLNQINEYIELSKEHDSFDNECLKVADELKKWGDLDLDDGIRNLETLIKKGDR